MKGKTGSSPLIETPKGQYEIVEQIAQGDTADIFRGRRISDDKAVCIKVAVSPRFNELIANERTILVAYSHTLVPEVLDSFETESGKAATILNLVKGFDLIALRELPLYRNGLVPRFHIGWVIERSLYAVGSFHQRMIVHGNIHPSHVIVDPDGHAVSLIDFSYAVKSPREGDFLKTPPNTYTAPELQHRSPVHPLADLYALGKCYIYLLGGDPVKNRIPRDVDQRIVDFIMAMVEEDPAKRADDAFKAAGAIVPIREKVFGNHGFVPLPIK